MIPLYMYVCDSIHNAHLKESLLLDKRPPVQCPEIQVGLATRHNAVCVRGMEVCSKHRLVGALR